MTAFFSLCCVWALSSFRRSSSARPCSYSMVCRASWCFWASVLRAAITSSNDESSPSMLVYESTTSVRRVTSFCNLATVARASSSCALAASTMP